MNPLGTGDPLRLGPYRLIGVLGVGGMGKVYLGRDGGGQPVAVKVLRPELAYDSHLVQRFVREAHAAEAVRSEGVARVLGAQTEGGRPWIATEFLAGPTLNGAVEKYGPFEAAAVRALGAVLARTLRDVHAAGLVHRDLKPSNIVLTSSGPRVIDFGIARPEHGLTLTTTGQAPVTPGYGPPEQVLGQRVGPSADVFALGAVLTYAATGVSAFSGGHIAAVQYGVVHGEPQLEKLPADLRPLIAPCLAKEADWRPVPDQVATVLAPPRNADSAWRSGPLAEDIAERERTAARLSALHDAGPATQAGGPGPGGGPSRRRVLTGLAAGGVLVAGGGAAAWAWLREGDADGADPWAAEPLSDYEEGTPPSTLWGPVQTAGDTSAAPLPVRDLVLIAPDGGRLAAYDVRDGRRRWQAKGVGPAARVVSPSEDEDAVFAAGESGRLVALNAEDGRERWSVALDVSVLLAADSEAVYVSTGDGRLRAVGTATRKELWTVRSPVRSTAQQPAQAAAADGCLVVYGDDGKAAGIAADSGKILWGPMAQSQAGGALAPAVAAGTVYLGGTRLRALTLADGKEKWARPSSGDSGWGAPAVEGDVLFAVDGVDLKACKTADGTENWTLTMESEELPQTAPVVQGHTVWVVLDSTGAGGVAAVDTRSGKKAWPYTEGDTDRWQLAAAGNRVFLLHGRSLTALPVF